jgi:hypothetical protein
MTLKDWIQLGFGLSNVCSFLLTFRPTPSTKIAGGVLLLIAHPTVAAYFLGTQQGYFVYGNAFMACAGVYAIVAGFRLRGQLARMLSDIDDVSITTDESGVLRITSPSLTFTRDAAFDLALALLRAIDIHNPKEVVG